AGPEAVPKCVCGSIEYGTSGQVVLPRPVRGRTEGLYGESIGSNQVNDVANILVVIPSLAAIVRQLVALSSSRIGKQERGVCNVSIKIAPSAEPDGIFRDEPSSARVVVY